MTITHRRAKDRGHADHGWLNSWHSFSFADYVDPAHMGFRTLRVINEDVVAPGTGFDTHGHRDMEIITYVTQGALAHKDSTGAQGLIRPGEVQHMTAGRGILHSEFNPSDTEDVKLLQIWITPRATRLEPGYRQTRFADEALDNRLCLIASPDGEAGSLPIQQDARILASRLDGGSGVAHALAAGRGAWVQLIHGRLTVNGEDMAAGDGAAITDETRIAIAALEACEFLLFDLA